MLLTPTTSELEGINLVLRSIQEAPITNPSNMSPIALQVRDALRQGARELFLRGYVFNTDEMELKPDEDKEIKLPIDALSLELTDTYNVSKYVQRDGKIYDRKNSTYKLNNISRLRVKITRWLPWNQRPEHVNQLIITKAALDMSREKISDPAAYSNSLTEYRLAERNFLAVESRSNNNLSVFNNPEMHYDDQRWVVYNGDDYSYYNYN